MHGEEGEETIVDLQTCANSFKDNAGVDTRLARLIIEIMREESENSKTLIVPLYTFVSTICLLPYYLV